jgi:hypothetical protein
MIMASNAAIRMDKPISFVVHPIKDEAPTRRMAMRMMKKIQKRYDFALLRTNPRAFRPWMNPKRVPFEAPTERSRVRFGGFRPVKRVEEARASARGGSTFSPPSVRVCGMIGVGGFENIFFSSLLNETERIIPMRLAKLTERMMRARAKSAPINPPV